MTSNQKLRVRKAILLASAAVVMPMAAFAADAATDAAADVKSMDAVMVIGSRLPANLSSMPGSVQVLGIEDIEKLTAGSSDLGRLLGQAVPGMGVAQNDASNFTNVIRGRKPAYLIDGFPQSLPLRGGGRDMRIIDVSAIERIEVIRGATALYGQGGAGGYINYITRRPQKDEWRFTSEVGLGASLSKFDSDSFVYTVKQLVMGGQDKWDILLNGSYEKTGVAYDAQGDAIPPDPFQQGGASEADTKNFLGKVGFDFTENQRLEATFNYYKHAQDTDVNSSTDAVVGSVKSQAVPKSSLTASIYGNGPIDPFTKNVFGALSYINQDVFGSSIKLQTMYQDYVGAYTFNPAYTPAGGTASLTGNKYAARFDVNTPLPFDGYVLWGVEWTRDKTAQEVLETGAIVMPRISLDTYAAFAQVHLSPTDWLSLNGGLRYEDAKLDVPDYQVAQQFRNPLNPALGVRPNAPVQGGKLSYNDMLFNLGAVVDVADDVSLFAGFSQGFTLTDIGRVLRNFSGGSVLDRVGQTDPQVTNNYEVGIRGRVGRLNGTIVFYYNSSQLGSSWDPITLDLVRAPERVWGAEIQADVDLDELRFGGTLGWANSELDANDDGVFEGKLNYWRVPPVKLTAYMEYDFAPEWTVRLDGMKVMDSNRFPEITPYTQSAASPINGYLVLDLSISGKVGPGRLSFGVQNLMNKEYFSVLSQTSVASRPDTYTMSPGATALLKYRINY